MTKSVVVVKVPNSYSKEQIKEIKSEIISAIDTYQVVAVVPSEVEIYSLPIE